MDCSQWLNGKKGTGRRGMELVILMLTAGRAVVEIRCGCIYSLEEEYTLLLNGKHGEPHKKW